MILMVFMIILFAGILALTLDFGFVLLARRQMQTGVNSAAREGLRGKGDPSISETDRRSAARDVMRLAFDDDLDLSSKHAIDDRSGNRQFAESRGNGYQSTTIGPDDTTLAEDLANRSVLIYRPDGFELNEPNQRHGDMVSGQYVPTATNSESNTYSRDDFLLSGDAGHDSDDAFLVRMRRTH